MNSVILYNNIKKTQKDSQQCWVESPAKNMNKAQLIDICFVVDIIETPVLTTLVVKLK